MLIEEAEKLYTSLIKEWVDEIVTDYTFSIASSSLPVLSPSDEKEQQGHPKQTKQLFRVTCIQQNIDLFNQKLIMMAKKELDVLRGYARCIYLKVKGADRYGIYRCSNDIRSHCGSPYIVIGRIYHDSK